eukprot:scaffold474_cov365-Prasinococcus_capsulatus_cf.AAC.4
MRCAGVTPAGGAPTEPPASVSAPVRGWRVEDRRCVLDVWAEVAAAGRPCAGRRPERPRRLLRIEVNYWYMCSAGRWPPIDRMRVLGSPGIVIVAAVLDHHEGSQSRHRGRFHAQA